MANLGDPTQLFGSCACERNQYTVIIPSSSTSRAQVFFDNSAFSRRTQASPVTAWLRVPLDWYSSQTIAYFPDETHSTIKRTFHTPSSNPSLPPTRRQFCGYCGSHLTQWNERLHGEHAPTGESGYLDVTLGSLIHESVERLEALRILPDLESSSSEDETRDLDEGLVGGGTINEDEDHVPTNEESMTGVDGPGATEIAPPAMTTTTTTTTPRTVLQQRPPHLMTNRGIPYFEEMVENSRLGRIKRQVGGHTSRDGTTSVQWEVIEIGADSEASATDGPGASKRPRLDV